MKYCILMGSPRETGNTASLLKPFIEELEAHGSEYDLISLYDKNISPCIACRVCQADWTKFGCRFVDDAQEIFDKILESDIVVLATPIYSWYCTPPMKSLLDRLVYGMNKFYGDEKGPALWEGRKLALVTTCGYRPEKGSDLFEAGMERYCKHSQLIYAGMLAERDQGYGHAFMTDEKEGRARKFVRKLENNI